MEHLFDLKLHLQNNYSANTDILMQLSELFCMLVGVVKNMHPILHGSFLTDLVLSLHLQLITCQRPGDYAGRL